MSWSKLTLLVLFAVSLACGQVLFKAAAQSVKGPMGVDLRTALQLATNSYLLLGLVIYGAATVLWIYLLRDLELSRAYPVVALAFVLVPLLGTFVFGEQLSVRLIAGIAVVILGLAIALW
jgi:drug/metabolite transporter (DMT)-like permease